MKQKLLLILTIGVFTTSVTFAQTASKVSGQINDNNGKPIAAATMMLQKAKDSALVKTAVTNATGNYEITPVKPGSYFVSATAAGMKKTSSAVFEVKENENAVLPLLTAQPATKDLEAVTVTSTKPMVEVKADKTILNVEGTINAVGND
ncbi:MAG: carboxypeptidase-like regulatory domain-containing protein, partial [Ferruginibacter sp.]